MDNQKMESNHRVDEKGRPAGGYSRGTGLHIDWQDGPLGRGESRKEPNGCFVETIIRAAKDRLEFYQSGGFECAENADAIVNLARALDHLSKRTARREEAETEGTHQGK